jgi:hypothetical protein
MPPAGGQGLTTGGPDVGHGCWATGGGSGHILDGTCQGQIPGYRKKATREEKEI